MKNPGKARLLLRPGAPGTLRLVEKYGEALLAVRYRYDEQAMKRYTTVELVVDESRWIPERCVSDPDREVGLRIGYEETALRARVRGVDARWDPAAKLWWTTLGAATQLNLEERIAAWGPPRVKISNTR
jgi:hypothetical protein